MLKVSLRIDRWRTMTTALASGRATLAEVQEIQHYMYCWGLEKTGSPLVAQGIVNCLHESFLLSLKQPVTNHYWPTVPGTRNWRYLCRRQIAALLGWSELIPEGHPNGIPSAVNLFLRTKQWPQFLDEDEGSSSGLGPNQFRLAPTPGALPETQEGERGTGEGRQCLGLTGRRIRAAPIARVRPAQHSDAQSGSHATRVGGTVDAGDS
jgi:hypothetical protein